ncbi:YihY/virulence factor BrkB family protein [Streptomyces sp. NPDC005438]|uniref:YihY/virulence factor BrkB family protein n=1 Tax=Streptomyces sp. NPDC005438 TaxID=3156880 RepID=UPI0033B24580
MDWLTRLPVVGPLIRWFMDSRIWRVYQHLDTNHWSRLAAAITFTSFLALFPMLAVGVAVGAALLPEERMKEAQDTLADQVPGIADQIDLQQLVDNAGAVGLIGGVLFLFTGVGWVSSLRESLRALWGLEEDPGNFVLLKLRDLGILIGLGLVGVLSFAGSTFAVMAVEWVAEQLGMVRGGVGTVLLTLAGYAAGVLADFLLLCYVLTALPQVHPPRRSVVVAGLIGAVGFEVLKFALGGYLRDVAAKSVYGAFGVPIALLLWISFMTKLLLFCAAWTATAVSDPEEADILADSGDEEDSDEQKGASDTEGAQGVEGATESGDDAKRSPETTGAGGAPPPGAAVDGDGDGDHGGGRRAEVGSPSAPSVGKPDASPSAGGEPRPAEQGGGRTGA